eukprot:2154101-Rhodomonas_salina.3
MFFLLDTSGNAQSKNRDQQVSANPLAVQHALQHSAKGEKAGEPGLTVAERAHMVNLAECRAGTTDNGTGRSADEGASDTGEHGGEADRGL